MTDQNPIKKPPSEAPKKGRRPRKPIYMDVRRLVDPKTGEELGALVPRYSCDRRAMKERKFHVGMELRADLTRARNPGFHRLAHVIGTLAVEQIEGFEHLDAHEALKKLQGETGVCCDVLEVDHGIGRDERGRFVNLGKSTIYKARSIAYDEMPEGDFNRVVKAVFALLSTKYWPGMSEDAIQVLCDMEMAKDGAR